MTWELYWTGRSSAASNSSDTAGNSSDAFDNSSDTADNSSDTADNSSDTAGNRWRILAVVATGQRLDNELMKELE